MFMAIVCILSLIGLFKYIHYLVINDYFSCNKPTSPKEGFAPASPTNLNYGPFASSKNIMNALFPTNPNIIEGLVDRGQPDTSHTVNLPINDPQSCKNRCMVGRCSATGQQCIADVDCPGCNPYRNSDPFDVKQPLILGNDDAGKLTPGMTPRYSSLTTDIGTQARVFDKANEDKPAMQANFGPNMWGFSAGFAQDLFNKRYRPTPGQYEFSPNYSAQPTTTGMFLNKEPLAANVAKLS